MTNLQLVPASSPFAGISVLGIDRNVETSQIRYGGFDLDLRRKASGHRRGNENLRATDGDADGSYEDIQRSTTQRRGRDGR